MRFLYVALFFLFVITGCDDKNTYAAIQENWKLFIFPFIGLLIIVFFNYLLGVNTDKNYSGGVRPVFRFLAGLLSIGAWFIFGIFVSQPGTARASALTVSLFFAVLFSVAAIFGKVPRWLYRMIPHSWSWEKRDDKHDS